MRKRFTIFQRLVFLILSCLILFSVFVFVLFSYSSRSVMRKTQLAELERTVKELVPTVHSVLSRDTRGSSGYYEAVLNTMPNTIGADIFVLFFDQRQKSEVTESTISPEMISMNADLDFMNYYLRSNHGLTERNIAVIINAIKAKRSELINLQAINFDIKEIKSEDELTKKDYLCIGMPVVSVTATGKNIVLGGIFVTKPKDNLLSGAVLLNLSLLIAVSLTLLLMIVPTVLSISRLIRPLVKTRDVALAIGKGDFTLRADENGPAEIGDLAKSMNQLAYDLNLTLSSLRFEKNRLQQILNNLAEGVIACDAYLEITHDNAAMKHLFAAYLSEECDWEENDEQVNWLQILNLQSDFVEVLKDSGNKIFKRKFGNLTVEIVIEALRNDIGNVVGVLGTFKDITEQELREQTQRDYVANVSHELRTPLTAIRGLIEPLADGLVETEEDRQRYYKIIMAETLRLSRLISEILQLSRLQANVEAVKCETFLISDLFDSIYSKFNRLASDRGIKLQVPELYESKAYFYSNNLPSLYDEGRLRTYGLNNFISYDSEIYSNFDYLEQLLLILIDNALKHTDKGGKIELVLSRNLHNVLTVSVVDTGCGISAEHQKYVFDRFYKIDSSREQTRGTGLGLSIAKQIVSSLDGQISVSSRLNKGSCFSFTVKESKDNDE